MAISFRKSIIVLLGLVVLLYAFAIITPKQLQAQGPSDRGIRPVRVVNEPTEPVQIQGDVEVTNVPDVNVSSMPDLNIANMPSTEIANTESNPVPVVQVSERVPYQFWDKETLSAGEAAVLIFGDVNFGKRLVIETVTVRAVIPGGQGIEACYITSTSGSIQHYIPLFKIGEIGSSQVFQGSQSVRFYVDSGKTADFFFRRTDSTGSATFAASLSGYLEPAS